MTLVECGDYLRASQVTERAFATVPLVQYSIKAKHNLDVLPPPELYDGLFTKRIPQLVDAGGQLEQVRDFAAIALWFPPGLLPPPAEDSEYTQKSHELKTKHMEVIASSYFLNTVAKDPARTEPGAVSELVKPLLEKATSGNGVVLEAIAERPMQIYLHYGFKVIDSFDVHFEDKKFTVYLMHYKPDPNRAPR